ncbi:Hypothetical protein HDN1F_27160 [gamma proteobacterium HdN1]|nr:Hypothetical protein HDN1F_27160 [gamma proteobacterium HdN1]
MATHFHPSTHHTIQPVQQTQTTPPRNKASAQELDAMADSQSQRSRQRIEWSRNAILGGWFVAMLGIVLYCFTMLAPRANAALVTSLLDSGAVGATALVLLLIGVGLWLVGSVVFLTEAEHTHPTDDEPKT